MTSEFQILGMEPKKVELKVASSRLNDGIDIGNGTKRVESNSLLNDGINVEINGTKKVTHAMYLPSMAQWD